MQIPSLSSLTTQSSSSSELTSPIYSEITAAILNQFPTPEAKLDCIESHIARDGSFKGLPFHLTILVKNNPNFFERVESIRRKLLEVSLDRIERAIVPGGDTKYWSGLLSNLKRQYQESLKEFPELVVRINCLRERIQGIASGGMNSPPDLENGEPPFKAARTTNMISVGSFASSSNPPDASAEGAGIDRTPTSASMRVAFQFSKAMLQLSCQFLDTPGLDSADVTAIVEQLETLCKRDSIKGEAALKLVEVYLNPNLGVRDPDKASHYYDIVCEEECEVPVERFEQGFMELAAIAMRKGQYSLCINLLKPKLGIPAEFYDSEVSISTLPSFDLGNRDIAVQILSRLSLAYYHTQNRIVAIRLLDLAADFGDEGIKEKLLSCFEETFKLQINDIENANKGFLVRVIKSDLITHQASPAKQSMSLLLDEAVKKGYITTSHKFLKSLCISIVANEALSRYFCSTGRGCGASGDCSERMIQLCNEITIDKENPHPLVAWIYVATNPTTLQLNPTRIERYVAIAQQGGFSDPRTAGAPLCPDLEQRATSTLFAGLEQGLMGGE